MDIFPTNISPESAQPSAPTSQDNDPFSSSDSMEDGAVSPMAPGPEQNKQTDAASNSEGLVSSLESSEVSEQAINLGNRPNTTNGATKKVSKSSFLRLKQWFDLWALWIFFSTFGLLVPTLPVFIFTRFSNNPTKIYATSLPDQCLKRVPEDVATLSSHSHFQKCDSNWSECAMQQSLACKSGLGFHGNANVYGLGIRLSVYFQWAVSIAGNYFRFDSQHDLGNAYILILLFYCIYGYIYMSTKSCTFDREVSILSGLFFGGNCCVYMAGGHTSNAELKFQGLTWKLAFKFALMVFFAFQSIRYSFLAERNQFVFEYPCPSSTLCFGVKIKQPPIGEASTSYDFFNTLSESLGLIQPSAAILIFTVSFLIMFPQEVANSVRESNIVQNTHSIFRARQPSSAVVTTEGRPATNTDEATSQVPYLGDQILGSSSPRRINDKKNSTKNRFTQTKFKVKTFLEIFITPKPLAADSERRRGITVIIVRLLIFVGNLLHVERTIAANAIQNVNNFNDTGQYLALVYAFITCFPVLRDCCYHFLRGRDLKRGRERQDPEQNTV